MNVEKKIWDFDQNFYSALYHLENGLEFLKKERAASLADTKYFEEALSNLERALADLKSADSLGYDLKIGGEAVPGWSIAEAQPKSDPIQDNSIRNMQRKC